MNTNAIPIYKKKQHLGELARYRREVLCSRPDLRFLFFELTIACNEHCRHCGSRCGDISAESPLSLEEWKRVVDQVAEDFPQKPYLCITGGEPLLYPGLGELMAYARDRGFHWGMTTNGTLITRETVRLLEETGMKTVSVSLDGLGETHEWFRQSPGSYEKTLEGIRLMQASGAFQHVQVTTVVHARNYDQLEDMYALLSAMGLRSWRVINVEPIGRALDQPELALTHDQLRGLISFIREKRFAGPMEVTYGCSHYLGLPLEREVRDWYFLCSAGIYTASVQYDGRIGACLDIERRSELIEGYIRTDRLSRVWQEGFLPYRTDFRKCGKCADCRDYAYCRGDSFHTWNFDKMEPYLCLKEVLEEEG